MDNDNYYEELYKRSRSHTDALRWTQNRDTYVKQSVDWFKEAIAKNGGNLRGSMKRKINIQKSVMEIGRMYFFTYQAKLAGTPQLPYWDAFPLVFPLDQYVENGVSYFTGLNLHYLQPNIRALLLDKLIQTTEGMIDKDRIYTSYTILKAAANFDLFKPCFKKYISSNVLGNFLYVPGEQWQHAIFLPVANWQDAKHSSVWKDTSAETGRHKRAARRKPKSPRRRKL